MRRTLDGTRTTISRTTIEFMNLDGEYHYQLGLFIGFDELRLPLDTGAPGLEIGDDLLDDVAHLIDLRVEFFLPVQEAAEGGLPDGVIISFPMYPMSPVQLRGSNIARAPDSLRQYESCRLPLTASEIQARFPSSAGDLDVHPGGLVLAEYSSGCEAHDQHGSRVPSTMYCVGPSSWSAVGTCFLSTFPSNGVTPATARLIVG
jgi:hypothetical protein